MTPKVKGNQVYYLAEYELRQRVTQRPTKTASWFWRRNTNTAANIPTTTRYSAIISLIVVCGQLENSKRIKLDNTIQTINEPENVRYSNKKLLQEKVATDTTIITGEGTKIECHKCFLIGKYLSKIEFQLVRIILFFFRSSSQRRVYSNATWEFRRRTDSSNQDG